MWLEYQKKKNGAKEIFKQEWLKQSKINDRHKTTNPGSLEDTKQDKYSKTKTKTT